MQMSRAIAVLDSALDVVRVITAVLAAIQLARAFGAPGIDHGAFAEVLPLWKLAAIYVAASGLTLYLGRLQAICTMNTSSADDATTPPAVADDEAPSVARN